MDTETPILQPGTEVPIAASAETEADPAPRRDPLVDSLVFLSHYFGRPRSAVALMTGLATVGGRLPIDLVGEAASRADLEVERHAIRRLDKLRATNLPAILLLEGGDACVLVEIIPKKRKTPAQARISRGTAEDDVEIVDLASLETGREAEVLQISPARSFDPRDPMIDERRPNSWFWSAFRQSFGIYGRVIGATVVINILTLATPLFIMNVYDRVVPSDSQETMWALAIGVLVAALFDFALRSFRGYFVDVAGRRADAVLGNRIFQRLLGARLDSVQMTSGARSNVVREYEGLREFFNSFTVATFGDMPFIILFIFVIWIIGSGLAIVPTVIVPVVLVICLFVQWPLHGLAKKNFNEGAHRNSVLFETLGGIETIKSVGAEGWAAGRWERAIAQSAQIMTKSRILSSIGMNVVMSAQIISTVCIVILGVAAIKKGEISPGALIASIILASRTLAPLGQVAGVLMRLHGAKVAFRAIGALIRAPQDRPPDAQYVTRMELRGDFLLDSVTFNYPGQKQPTLRGISLRIRAGEKIGIIGAIGSGKSTLLKLLLRLYEPSDGVILADGIDIRNIDPTVVRSSIGYMPQGGDVFSGTIRSNIGLHVPFADDAAVIGAAKRAGSFDWIQRLPSGFDTAVGERGIYVSGGQRQSVALTRALLRDPAILALDEPTSEMDGSVEAAFIKQLGITARDKTVILVTHKGRVLDLVDRLIVLENGQIAVDGPRDKVVAHLRKVRAKQQGAALAADSEDPRPSAAAADNPGPATPIAAIGGGGAAKAAKDGDGS